MVLSTEPSVLLLSLLFYTTQDHLPERWTLKNQPLVKNIPTRACLEASIMTQSLNLGSLFPGDLFLSS